MANEFGTIIVFAGFGAWIVFALVSAWPWRRRWEFILRIQIAAPRERVWNTNLANLDDPSAAAFHVRVVSNRRTQTDPDRHELVLDQSGGHRTHLVKILYEILEQRPPEFLKTRYLEIDGKVFPFGQDGAECLLLEAHPAGTLATLSWRGETATWGQFAVLRRRQRLYLRQLKTFCETGVAPAAKPGQRLHVSLAMSALAIGSFALWLGWQGALILAGVLIVHEFGHWLAMRLTGQPAPRLMLVPFFGGIALANHPHRTLFDDAFCALMGAGFSAILCLALALGIYFFLPDRVTDSIAFIQASYGPHAWARIAAGLTIATAIINLFQLLPFLTLDGGQVVRALMQSFSGSWARRLLLLIAVLGLLGFLHAGQFLLAGVLAVGALQAWHLLKDPPRARPMGGIAIAAIVLGYVLTVAVHSGAAIYGFWVMRLGQP